MRLLHLSDIHFQEPACLVPLTDPERPYRTRLKTDLVALCRDKSVDAILVGGDIAFKGHKDEYETARAWLLELAAACGCKPEEIYVVPGNHDVDRGVCNKQQTVKNAQTQIANSAWIDREQAFRDQLGDPHTGQALFLPLSEYNKFAEEFGCNVYPDRPYWRYDVPLGGDVMLSMHGLTSTLISGLGQRDDAPGKLYLSPLQTSIDPRDDALNLVICHHPPSWFLDAHDIEDKVNTRAPLQLFGHEHRSRCTRTPEYMRFAAGAVNPDRRENDWLPGYNLIDLEVDGEGQNRTIAVEAHVRFLHKGTDRFTAQRTSTDEAVWTHRIPLPSTVRRSVPSLVGGVDAGLAEKASTQKPLSVATLAETSQQTVEDAMSSPNTKNLRYRFGNLSTSQKRELALKLKLITEADMSVPGPERYAQALKRAVERGQVDELAREIDRLEQQG